MASHAQVAAQLLRNAAKFFREVGGQNSQVKEQMGKKLSHLRYDGEPGRDRPQRRDA
jgi:hypothetical protein